MIRLFLATGQSAGVTLAVPYNRKWRLLNAVLSLVSSATVGTRSVNLVPYIGGSNIGSNPLIPVSTSTVSVTTNGFCQIGNQSQTTNLPSPPVFSEYDQLKIVPTLLAGDTFSYWIEVEEDDA